MISEIQINTSAFGKISEQADSLIIELSGSTIQFCEMNAEQNKLLFIASYPIETNSDLSIIENLINAIRHFQFSKKSYKNIYVNYFNTQFTLCPINFYVKENLRSLLEFNIGSINDQLIETDDITADIKLIYAVNEQLKSTLDNLFPNHHIKHTLSVLTKLMLNAEEMVKENILISLHATHIEIIVKQDHKLILANQYAIKTQEDVLYYILFILEQYQLNPLFVNVCVTGNIDSNSTLITSLKKYIKNIRLAKGHKSLDWQNVSGLPQHFNYTLINRIFCE